MRIIAGLYKGRKLLSPPADSIARPITGSAKKSLFDILASRLPDSTVADLYCATGTLGLEALSRGAARCFFAERDPAAVERLRRNIEAVAADDRCEIWQGDIEMQLGKRLRKLALPVDIAFVDPPYDRVRTWNWQQAQENIFGPLAARLAADGLVVLRTAAKLAVPSEMCGLVILRSRKYGTAVVTIYALGGQANGRGQTE